MNVIIPLAGPDLYSKRFGLRPLYVLEGLPLLMHIRDSRPWLATSAGTELLFVLRKETGLADLKSYISEYFPGSKLVELSNPTKGALLSAACGIGVFSNPTLPLCIDLADIVYTADFSPETIFQTHPEISGILPWFSSNDACYSYLEICDNWVVRTREKEVISAHASAGTYFFRDTCTFLSALQYSLERSSGFFVCPSFNGLINESSKVLPVEVKLVQSFSKLFKG